MDKVFMNQYEKQLYTVFKTFDLDNEDALDRASVSELCNALQLEQRGPALIASLFSSGVDRVSFSQFRSEFLSVLGAEAVPQPSSEPVPQPADKPPLPSDDDSSGREVAPKFTFGSKKYGRRSRPSRTESDVSTRHRVASESRLEGERAKQRSKCKRSSSVMESRADCSSESDVVKLDHDQTVDRDRAREICQGLQMHGVDVQFIDRVFVESKTNEMSVGQFFDRLNVSLQSSLEHSLNTSLGEDTDEKDIDVVPSDAVVEAWEQAGVQTPRRLLHEIGFTTSALPLRDLERAIEEELQAFHPGQSEPEPHTLLLLASRTLSRLRVEQIQHKLDMTFAERDKLKSDLLEANKRARLLAQDVDENHARIESDLKGRLRAMEAKYSEAARAAALELSAERERAQRDLARLRDDLARRADLEARLRADLDHAALHAQHLEEKVRESEVRAEQAEREAARAGEEARREAERAQAVAAGERAQREAAEARLAELRADHQRLRDRADELAAALDPPRHQTTTSPDQNIPDEIDNVQGLVESPHDTSLEESAPPPETASAAAEGEADLRAQLEALKAAHQSEVESLNSIIKELEEALEAMRRECDGAEEYWAARLRDERAEAAAQDARLAELADKVAAYERQFALPAIYESALEDQHRALEHDLLAARARLARQEELFTQQKKQIEDLERVVEEQQQQLQQQRGQIQQHEDKIQQQMEQIRRHKEQLQRRACAPLELRPRAAAHTATQAARAERAVQRLQARLAAADLLVTDLYLENCRLAHRAPL